MRRGPEYNRPPQSESTGVVMARYVSNLVRKGIIQQNYSAKDPANTFVVDPELAIDLFERTFVISNVAKAQGLLEDRPTTPTYDPETYQQETQRAFQQSVKALVDRDIMPPALAVQVGRIVRPTDISIGQQHELQRGEFEFRGKIFPRTAKQRRAKVQFEVNMTGSSILKDTELYRVLHGVYGYSDEQIHDVSRRISTGHEYGHAIDATVALLTRQSLGRKIDLPGVRKRQAAAIFSIAPNYELLEEYKADPSLIHEQRIPAERFATGMEYLNLRHVLEENGLGADQSKMVAESVAQSRYELWKPFVEPVSVARSYGISRVALAKGVEVLGEEMLSMDSLAAKTAGRLLIGSFPKIHPAYTGYFFPLTEPQIKEYIDYTYGQN